MEYVVVLHCELGNALYYMLVLCKNTFGNELMVFCSALTVFVQFMKGSLFEIVTSYSFFWTSVQNVLRLFSVLYSNVLAQSIVPLFVTLLRIAVHSWVCHLQSLTCSVSSFSLSASSLVWSLVISSELCVFNTFCQAILCQLSAKPSESSFCLWMIYEQCLASVTLNFIQFFTNIIGFL
jgi:hypothetical protein